MKTSLKFLSISPSKAEFVFLALPLIAWVATLVLYLWLEIIALVVTNILISVIWVFTVLNWKHLLWRYAYRTVSRMGIQVQKDFLLYRVSYWTTLLTIPMIILFTWYILSRDTYSLVFFIPILAILGALTNFLQSRLIAKNLSIISDGDLLFKKYRTVNPEMVWYLPLTIKKLQTIIISQLKDRANSQQL